MGRRNRSKLAECVLWRGHRLLSLILDPKAIPEPNRKEKEKSVVSSFWYNRRKPKTVRRRHWIYLLTMANYYCEYCGHKSSSVQSLTSGNCLRHPLGPFKGRHKLYEGKEEARYVCEYCGHEASSISGLTSGNCLRHPDGTFKGKHKPFEGGLKSRYTCKYCGHTTSTLTSLTSGNCLCLLYTSDAADEL